MRSTPSHPLLTRLRHRHLLPVLLLLLRALPACASAGAEEPRWREPVLRAVDLDVGERREVVLADGSRVEVLLRSLREDRCTLRGAVRRAEVDVEVAGRKVTLVSATYHLPREVGSVQIDCPVTRGYTRGSSKDNVWALEKDARLRLWPGGAPWVRPGSFECPVPMRWFASDTQMGNDPCYVNACDVPGQSQVYYHYGLDFGGVEGVTPVVAATDGEVVSRAGEILAGGHPSLVKPRHDVVYLRDERGWYYRYSHLKSIADSVRLGGSVRRGDPIGVLGKEGGSGGWSHLHFDVSMVQPSGRYGILDAYALTFQAYRDRRHPRLVASARPHSVAWVGDTVLLDARTTWHVAGPDGIRGFEWSLSDGRRATGPAVRRTYSRPGHYSEPVRVIGRDGETSIDFAIVQVFDRAHPTPVPPAIHVACWPTSGVRTGDEVLFKTRTFGVRPDEGEETWDFGDGSPAVRTRSDGNANQHAPEGYAVTRHRYREAGDHIVTVRRTNDRGEVATGRVWIRVEGP